MTTDAADVQIAVRDVTMAFGSFVVMRDLEFTVRRGEVCVLMGGSGCGKSTLLNHLIGLLEPAKGEILYDGTSFTRAAPEQRDDMLRQIGVLFQSGALWSLSKKSGARGRRSTNSSARANQRGRLI